MSVLSSSDLLQAGERYTFHFMPASYFQAITNDEVLSALANMEGISNPDTQGDIVGRGINVSFTYTAGQVSVLDFGNAMAALLTDYGLFGTVNFSSAETGENLPGQLGPISLFKPSSWILPVIAIGLIVLFISSFARGYGIGAAIR